MRGVGIDLRDASAGKKEVVGRCCMISQQLRPQ